MKHKPLLDASAAKALHKQASRLEALDEIVTSKSAFCQENIWPLRVGIFSAIEAENDPNFSDEKVFSLYEKAKYPSGSVREQFAEYKQAKADLAAAAKEAAEIRPGLKKTIEAFFDKQHEVLLTEYHEQLEKIVHALTPYCGDAGQAEFLAMQTSAATTLYSSALGWKFSSIYNPSLLKLSNLILQTFNV